jgi:hypothetical protein
LLIDDSLVLSKLVEAAAGGRLWLSMNRRPLLKDSQSLSPVIYCSAAAWREQERERMRVRQGQGEERTNDDSWRDTAD